MVKFIARFVKPLKNMIKQSIKWLIILVAIIHLLPLAGVLGIERLESLYAIKISDPNLEILMRHRAVMFGLLGFLFLYSAFQPKLQWASLIIGFISVISFLILAFTIGDFNEAIQNVIIADFVALAALLIASVLKYISIEKN